MRWSPPKVSGDPAHLPTPAPCLARAFAGRSAPAGEQRAPVRPAAGSLAVVVDCSDPIARGILGCGRAVRREPDEVLPPPGPGRHGRRVPGDWVGVVHGQRRFHLDRQVHPGRVSEQPAKLNPSERPWTVELARPVPNPSSHTRYATPRPVRRAYRVSDDPHASRYARVATGPRRTGGPSPPRAAPRPGRGRAGGTARTGWLGASPSSTPRAGPHPRSGGGGPLGPRGPGAGGFERPGRGTTSVGRTGQFAVGMLSSCSW